ncbi:Pycsar system effector family protein [Phytohabitans rumicis]|uniref:Pycsar system effector family protein n=1 Tax=Phytohabitans rumicis TaxID=1076125 RepID=UPI0031F097C6
MRPDRTMDSSPAEFAWRVHTALESWTAKVDMKASIMLAFQGGVLIFVSTSPPALVGARPGAVAGAMVLLLTAMGFAATAILPALGAVRRHRRECGQHWIYFGHLRLWQPVALESRLAVLTERDEVRALSTQLIRMSRLNWRKHRLLQGSVLLTLLAMLVMLVAVTAGWGR